MSKPIAPRVLPVVWIVAVIVIAGAAVVATSSGWHRNVAAKNAPAAALRTPAGAQQRSQVRASIAALPLAFEANQGQTDAQVKYMARGNGYTVFLTGSDAVFTLHSSSAVELQSAARRAVARPGVSKAMKNRQSESVVRMNLLGGNAQAKVEPSDRLNGKTNYFIGNDGSKWHTGVPQFARVSYRDVYPGVNMAFYGVQRQLEFDFIIAPGADPTPIQFGVSGTNRNTTDESGNLVLSSSAGDVMMHKPVAYQEKNGKREPVDARFVLTANNRVSFELGNYDHSRELVIDPSVSYATYLGGTGEDDGNAIAIDGSGNAYITGQTASTTFPTVTGGYQTTNAGGFDAFITEIKADGSALVYSTFVGGSGSDSGNAIVVDASGDAFVAGGTNSTNFPHTTGAYETAPAGGLDGFVLELNAGGGTLTFSTYLGGSGDDFAGGIALDSSGIYVVGTTKSSNFPTTPGVLQSALAGSSNGFVTKLNSTGSALVYSTYLGGGTGDLATAVAVNSSNEAYVTGGTQNAAFVTTAGAFQTTCGSCSSPLTDAFVSVIKAEGSGFVYSTFLGGSNTDLGLGIALDSSGDAYVTGQTASNTDFPTKSTLQAFGGGFDDGFVTELNPAGSALVFSTFLGGSANDVATGIALDGAGTIYVTGETLSTNFPTKNATQTSNGGGDDAFVSEISPGGSSLVFSTYLGGSGSEDTTGGGSIGAIAVDTAGANIYVTGNTNSADFPTVSAKYGTNGGGIDAFIAKYTQTATGSTFTVGNGALSATSGAPGASATSTITVTSVNGFNSAVTLSCAVTAVVSEGPTCAFSNPGSSVTPPANGVITATLTVSTTAASSSMQRPSRRQSGGLFYALFLPIGGIALFGAAGTRRKKLFGLLMLGMVLASLLFMPACGGSSSSGGGGGGGNAGTPTGTYNITVTGTSGATVVTDSPALTFSVN